MPALGRTVEPRTRVRTCLTRPAGGGWEIRRTADGRMVDGSWWTCGSAWECPACATRIRAARAAELTAAAQRHREGGAGRKPWRGRGGEVYLLTLTLRHRRSDTLLDLRQGLTAAWRRMTQGSPWKRLAASCGLLGSVRAVETTWSREHGWHPHLHVLMFAGKLGSRELRDLETRLGERWCEMVERELGAERRPSMRKARDGKRPAVDLRPSKKADYLTKLGLEVTGVARLRVGSQTPWSMLLHAEERAERRRWLEYCESMRGVRALTWSKSLAGYREEDVSDAELAARECATVERVAVIPSDAWRELRRWGAADQWVTALLWCASRGGLAEVVHLAGMVSAEAAASIRAASLDAAQPSAARAPPGPVVRTVRVLPAVVVS